MGPLLMGVERCLGETTVPETQARLTASCQVRKRVQERFCECGDRAESFQHFFPQGKTYSYCLLLSFSLKNPALRSGCEIPLIPDKFGVKSNGKLWSLIYDSDKC